MLDFTQAANSLTIPPHVRIGKTPDVFSSIREPGINLVIWERDLPASVVKAIAKQNLNLECTHEANGNPIHFSEGTSNISRRYSRKKRIHEILNQQSEQNLKCLTEDQVFLADIYFKLFPEISSFSYLSRVQCGPQADSQISHFHLDRDIHSINRFFGINVKAKTRANLITTYFGASGTEWLPEGTFTRFDDLASRTPRAAPLDDIYIRRLKPGDVALMWMGYVMEGESEDGIYHRTPLIAEGEARGTMIFSPHDREMLDANARFVRSQKLLSPVNFAL